MPGTPLTPGWFAPPCSWLKSSKISGAGRLSRGAKGVLYGENTNLDGAGAACAEMAWSS